MVKAVSIGDSWEELLCTFTNAIRAEVNGRNLAFPCSNITYQRDGTQPSALGEEDGKAHTLAANNHRCHCHTDYVGVFQPALDSASRTQ